MSVQTYDLLAISLHELRTRLGDDLFAERKRMTSLLFDKAPEAKREIRALATAVEEGVPAALLGAERHHLGMEMDRQAALLESTTGIRLDIALPIVRLIAFALDLGPLPSVYQQAAASPAPVAAPAAAAVASPVAGASAHPAPQPAYSPPAGPASAPASGPAGFLDKLPFDKKYLAFGAAGLVILVLGLQMLAPRTPPGPTPPGPAQNDQQAPAAAQQTNFAGEMTDYGVPAKRELESNVGSPTPMTIPVGRRITTGEVQALIAADPTAVLIDVLADPHATTIRNAVFIPAAGMGGSVGDAVQPRVVESLRQASGGQQNRPLVFFCAGAICWESYNAVLRAHAAGYRNLYWYRGGLGSWSEARLPMQPLQAQQAPPAANFFQ